ncbi:MAG: hypothetical protein IPI49_15060 [Myxococcales bacterium]|nr:hypothetical protein [Myxococcales bacterium]
MPQAHEFILDFDLAWRIFEGASIFERDAGTVAARDFLRPLALVARDQVSFEDITVDADGEGVTFLLADQRFAIRCQAMRLQAFLSAVNHALAAANLQAELAIVESQRYELRAVLITADNRPRRTFARGTIPP